MVCCVHNIVEPKFNEVPGMTSDILQPGQSCSKCMEKNLDIMNPR